MANEKNNKFELFLTYRYSPILFACDHLFRLVVLVSYIKYNYSTWYFIIVQILLIIISFLIHDNAINKIKSKSREYINPSYSNLNLDIIITENIPNKLMGYQMLFGYAFSFWFFYHIFDNHLWYHYIFIILLSFVGLIPFVLVLVFTPLYKSSKGIRNFKVINISQIKQIKTIRKDVTSNFKDLFIQGLAFEPEAIEFENIDLNDTKIAKLESELKNLNYKAEAWLLESVFLGGLAFSGFLTVASGNFIGIESETFKTFVIHINEYINTITIDNIFSLNKYSYNSFSREDLYIVIMVLCLLSSVFFLLILTLRLRLNSLVLNLDHIMRILVIFNSKEEEIFNISENLENQPKQFERFNKIQRKIDIALIDAEKLLIKIRPVIIMMNIYRTIAIFLFYLVLILSGLYFMPIISAGILGLAIFTFLFKKIETYINIGEIRQRVRRH